MSILLKLKQQIDALEKHVNNANLSELNESLFDEHLFYTQKVMHNSTFYLEKIKQTYQALSESVITENNDKIDFLSELLINQITAMTREIATHHLRAKEPDIFYESLPHKHARYLDYLRRLQEMKYELELTSDGLNYKKIATIDNRIYRCEQAIKQIENQIENEGNLYLY